ncbi:bifunctional glutamate N-acetyltransferase/amino-acid acetyltransferase ArgJ [Planctomycetales bacterium ZRK34]|nr:bifunctional glutamate N-acetyltransferase/amino-acid acetyltransferase ArgJ [Planctomycetales bacterium ZRK34]
MPLSHRSITVPQGFKAAGTTCGIKVSRKNDLALIVADQPAVAAAVFTQNAVPSEPVQLGRKHMKSGKLRAIVCNSGCANASTGKQGLENALAMCTQVAELIGCKPTEVLACSTGVIGHQLPMKKIAKGIEHLAGRVDVGSKSDNDAASSIMTTDLVAKAALVETKIGSKPVVLAGIAKGSGMISPNMATMLAFITTDVAISAPLLRSALKEAVNADASFNRISVDTDTSPSDTVAVMASAAADNPVIKTRGAHYKQFTAALTELCQDLAYQIISDGEGVTRVIRVKVESAKSEVDALKIARAVADSPLVKTAVHGSDPNWGRLTAAAGKCGAAVNPGKLCVFVGDIEVYKNGGPVEVDLGPLRQLMRQKEVVFTFKLHLGKGTCEFLGCDLTREYITINADYHT